MCVCVCVRACVRACVCVDYDTEHISLPGPDLCSPRNISPVDLVSKYIDMHTTLLLNGTELYVITYCMCVYAPVSVMGIGYSVRVLE